MIQPEALKQQKPWLWSPGIGTDVWAMFCACITGDLETVKQLVAKDPSLVRAHYEYRTPLSFAVRENQLAVADFLLDHGAEPLALGDVMEMARDRGYAEMTQLLERKLAEPARRLVGRRVGRRGDPRPGSRAGRAPAGRVAAARCMPATRGRISRSTGR